MNGRILLSSREKKIFAVVAGAVIVFLCALVFRSWGAVLAGVTREERELKEEWGYASSLLARSRSIEERHGRMKSRHPMLFEEGRDPARLMADLDAAAKAAGVQVNMIRPAAPGFRFEMAFRGSWPQVMRFFQSVEGQDHFFRFSTVSVHRQERTGELQISATVQK